MAFITLVERKLIGSVQRRRGPNKAGLYGILQAIADALKLLSKEFILPKKSQIFVFLFSPILCLFISLLLWLFLPFNESFIFFNLSYGILFIICLTSFGVYSIFFAGWTSQSRYAFIGGLRAISQMISYELCFSFIFLFYIFINSFSLSLYVVNYLQDNYVFFFCFPFIVFIFYFVSLAELNRVPFDLPEAESELVAGYNVEYSSLKFAMFFLGEYSMMLIFSVISSFFFWGGWFYFFNIINFFSFFDELNFFILFFHSFVLSFKICVHMCFIILIRSVLPRYRYDQLIKLGWKFALPLSCFIVFFYFMLVFFFYYL